jgi:hypothetical protein
MGDGGQGEPDDRRDPLALTEGDDERANGLPVLDQLEDGPLGGSHPPHHRAPGRPMPSVQIVAFGIELGEAFGVEGGLGLADVGDHDLMVGEATPDHHPAGVQERVDALGGDLATVLTGGRGPGDRVEQADDAGLGVGCDGLAPAGSPGEARGRPVPNSSATVITWATESIRSEW